MRGVLGKSRRQWMTWGEFEGSLAIFGIRTTPYFVRKILAGDPPAKVNGAYRYEMRHLDMVRKHLEEEQNGLAVG